MDLSHLKIALQIVGVLAPLFAASKHPSDLRLNRVSLKKQVAELIGNLTGWLKNHPHAHVHPMEVQATFQAAFGGALQRIPSGQEILDLLKNETVATLSTVMEFAICLEFVAYSKAESAFVPRGPWTYESLRRERIKQLIYYVVAASICIACIGTPKWGDARFLAVILTGPIALVTLWRTTAIGRAEKFLQRVPRKAAEAA